MKNTYEIKDNTDTINAFKGHNVLEAINNYLAYFDNRGVNTIKSVILFHYGSK
tara:strand:- start:247 stop:405 length:159 start_codon:yes stop_codon:yes gene_type:complete